jgi:hypothetical protein
MQVPVECTANRIMKRFIVVIMKINIYKLKNQVWWKQMNQLNYDKLISHSSDKHLFLNFWVSFVSKYLLHGFHSFQGLLPVPSKLCHSFQRTCVMHANLSHMKPVRNKILRLLQVPIQEWHEVLFQKVPMQLIVGWCCLWQWIQNKYRGNNSTQCYRAVSNSWIWGLHA